LSQASSELRVGGVAALLGGTGGLVGNVLHPTPPAETEALLRVVAAMPHWTAIHLMITVSAVFMVGAFGLLVSTLEGARSRAIGDLARYAAVLGGAALMAGIMIDGYSYPYLARVWLAAEGEQKAAIFWAADAVHVVDLALFAVWSTVFLGLAFLLAGAALFVSGNYSRLLGVIAMVGGAMCLLFGCSVALRFESPLPVWPLGAAVDSVWLLAVGVSMLRKARLSD
jgi:hypothetical protein